MSTATGTDSTTIAISDPATLVTVLRAAGRARVTPCIWGDPGIAKSSIVRAVADVEQMPCAQIIGAHHDPTDFAGLPIITDDGVRLDAPAWAKALVAAGRGLVFLDEFSSSAPAVQAAMLGVVLERTVGDLPLPDDVWVIAAANPPERAADGWDLTAPMANRLLHLHYAPSATSWIDGMTAGFSLPASGLVYDPDDLRRSVSRAQVAAFIRTRPALLHSYPTETASAGRAWPSRRTWTMTADVLALLPDDAVEARMVVAAGLVGHGAAREFEEWRRNADLPDPAAVVADPAVVNWAGLDAMRTWAILSAVVGYCTAPGTAASWSAAWTVLGAAAEHDRGDIATACARSLLTARPAKAPIPNSVKKFRQSLVAAGILPARGDAA